MSELVGPPLELRSKFSFTEQATKQRLGLNALVRRNKWSAIGNTPGISVIRSRRAYPSQIDCAIYALGLANLPYHEAFDQAIRLRDELSCQPEVDEISRGDIILYFRDNRSFEKSVVHVGVMIDEQLVRSKWNHGPVYQHPVWLVPSNFGNEVRIVRR